MPYHSMKHSSWFDIVQETQTCLGKNWYVSKDDSFKEIDWNPLTASIC